MILHGNQRGGAKDLAVHLMKPENETVQVHDVRGFISTDVMGALTESYAMSRATKCRQHLFSMSLNPPKGKTVSDQDFVEAAELAEQRLGLSKQPRIIVFHEKYGDDGQLRKHAHAVWSRIDTQRMKAVQLSYTKRKMVDVGRELYIRHGWRMPHGFIDPKRRDPKNFTLAEWQQAKRQGRDAKTLKAMFQERWAISDSAGGFAHALEEQGFFLAKGDQRGFVAVDYQGEVYSISRWVGVKAKAVREKLGAPDDQQTVQQAHAKAAAQAANRLRKIREEQHQKVERFRAVFERRRQNQTLQNRRKAAKLAASHRQKEIVEDALRKNRLRKGLMGFIDRLTGYRRKMEGLNQAELESATKRNLQEKQSFALKFKSQASMTHHDADQKANGLNTIDQELANDIGWLERLPDSQYSAITPSTEQDLVKSHVRSPTRSEPEI